MYLNTKCSTALLCFALLLIPLCCLAGTVRVGNPTLTPPMALQPHLEMLFILIFQYTQQCSSNLAPHQLYVHQAILLPALKCGTPLVNYFLNKQDVLRSVVFHLPVF